MRFFLLAVLLGLLVALGLGVMFLFMNSRGKAPF
jgi:hypothetical protein